MAALSQATRQRFQHAKLQVAAKEASEVAHLAGLQAQMAAKRAALESQRTERLAAGAAARSALVSSSTCY